MEPVFATFTKDILEIRIFGRVTITQLTPFFRGRFQGFCFKDEVGSCKIVVLECTSHLPVFLNWQNYSFSFDRLHVKTVFYLGRKHFRDRHMLAINVLDVFWEVLLF